MENEIAGMSRINLLFFSLCITSMLLSVSKVIAQPPIEGKWVTVDDNTGKERSVVEISAVGDRYIGTIIDFFPEEGEDPDPICELCSGKRKNQKILGMQITNEMQLKEDALEGEILDPENGKTYRCKIWLEDQTLKVRGYVMFLYRTQTWLPLEK